MGIFAGLLKRVKNGVKTVNNKLKNAVDPLGLFHNTSTGESKLTKINNKLQNAVDPLGLFHNKNEKKIVNTATNTITKININANCEKRVSSKPPIPQNKLSNAYVVNATNATNKTIFLVEL